MLWSWGSLSGHQWDPQAPAAPAGAGHRAGLPWQLEISLSWHHGETENHIKVSLRGCKGLIAARQQGQSWAELPPELPFMMFK